MEGKLPKMPLPESGGKFFLFSFVSAKMTHEKKAKQKKLQGLETCNFLNKNYTFYLSKFYYQPLH